jgi:hypothetical protein
LARLRDDGFEIEIRSSFLLVHNVPYVNAQREIKFGVLVSDLSLAGDVTTHPENHVAHFIGTYPCDKDGVEIEKIKNQSQEKSLGPDLAIQHSFSSKPTDGYIDYHHKMQTYFAIISGSAYSIDPILPRPTRVVVESDDEESVFNYADTASSRAEINTVTDKLRIGPVAIVGLGGTGSYILDQAAKTPVTGIHLYDGDRFLQRNAFRSPGAPSIDELRAQPMKVDYFKAIYSKMHARIHAHPEYVTEANVGELTKMAFVFTCLDRGEPRRLIFDALTEAGIPFIDVGMGVECVDGSLRGIVRVTTSTAENRDHVAGKVSFSDSEADDYATNIQIADLNMLNAAFAVIRWKKLFDFYSDLEGEHSSTYTIDGNALDNEDKNAPHDADAQVRRVHPR